MTVSLPMIERGHTRRSAPPALQSAPDWFHLIDGDPPLVFVVSDCRLFQLDRPTYQKLAQADPEALAELALAGDAFLRYAPQQAAVHPRALSIHLAQSCNLACSYCYADHGKFSGRAIKMDAHTALRAVDELLDHATARATIGFIGGEPFANRALLWQTAHYARERARTRQLSLGFSVTTNGTLLRRDDVEQLREFGFVVTVSMDGGAAIHDRHRKLPGGGGSFARTMQAIRPLLEHPGAARIAARATVTRDDLRVHERVSSLLAEGFAEVGVSPARTGPTPEISLRDQDFGAFLREMERAGQHELEAVLTEPDRPLRFANLAHAVQEIMRGTRKTLPCGAGASYVSLAADGRYYTCHRVVGDAARQVGSIQTGVDTQRRVQFVQEHSVERHAPCAVCWARYLCGGGCHAEVALVGRDSCDYIRGWLEFCMRASVTLSERRMDLLPVRP